MNKIKYKKGISKNKPIFGVGINDLHGKCSYIDKNGKRKIIKSYQCWTSMLERCYSEQYQKKQPTYIDCKISNEWLIYSNFKKWYDDNFKNIEGICRMELDKDLLGKGEKIYSEETCLFLPNSVNNFMTNIKSTNTIGFTGVNKRKIKYRARISDFKTGKRIHLGDFKTAKLAGDAYNIARIKQCEVVKEYMRELGIYSEEIISQVR